MVVVVAPAIVDAADLPDRAGAGNLHQRGVRTVGEARPLIGVARVAHRAVVDEIRRAVGPEPDGRRTVDAAHFHDERLLGLTVAPRHAIARIALLVRLPAIEREAQLSQLRWRVPGEIHELDVVSGFRRAIRLREAEIAFAREQHAVLLHDAADERV